MKCYYCKKQINVTEGVEYCNNCGNFIIKNYDNTDFTWINWVFPFITFIFSFTFLIYFKPLAIAQIFLSIIDTPLFARLYNYSKGTRVFLKLFLILIFITQVVIMWIFVLKIPIK